MSYLLAVMGIFDNIDSISFKNNNIGKGITYLLSMYTYICCYSYSRYSLVLIAYKYVYDLLDITYPS